MRAALRPVGSRAVGIVALLALVPVALMLWRGELTLVGAAERATAVLVGAMIVERIALPIAALLLGPLRVPPDPEDPEVLESGNRDPGKPPAPQPEIIEH